MDVQAFQHRSGEDVPQPAEDVREPLLVAAFDSRQESEDLVTNGFFSEVRQG
ncbi:MULTISPECIES: hypothetical protein [Frankia]|uniref:hypothetical protein n=1 Tax=Frankia TaxID=1854 RepID=UPI0013C33614|nr:MULTISPECIES: hypothetical protein [Frankia]